MKLYQEERICKNCGKVIYVLHPSRWAYKKKKASECYEYYCTWKCMREDEKGKKKMGYKITPEKRAEAIRIAIDGGDVLDFLKKNGSDAPDKLWWYIKNQLKEKDPDTYAKLPQQKKPEPKKAQPKKKQAEKKPLAEVAKKLPGTEAVVMTREEHSKAHRPIKTIGEIMDYDATTGAKNDLEQPDLKVKSLFSNVIEGAFFAKGERGVPMSIRTYTTMTLVSKSNPFVMDNQLKDCKLELTKEEWLKLIDEISEALDKMEI